MSWNVRQKSIGEAIEGTFDDFSSWHAENVSSREQILRGWFRFSPFVFYRSSHLHSTNIKARSCECTITCMPRFTLYLYSTVRCMHTIIIYLCCEIIVKSLSKVDWSFAKLYCLWFYLCFYFCIFLRNCRSIFFK